MRLMSRVRRAGKHHAKGFQQLLPSFKGGSFFQAGKLQPPLPPGPEKSMQKACTIAAAIEEENGEALPFVAIPIFP